MNENEKIIGKIKKVLELSQNNPSVEEAKAAALKAQKLMAEYHISMTEVEVSENLENIVEESVNVGTGNKWKYALANIVSKNFRCRCFSHGKHSIVFYGYKEDTKIAAMTFKMLFDFGNKESISYYQKLRYKSLQEEKNFNGKGIKNAFLNGYLMGIKEGLERQCTALMIVIPKEVNEQYKNMSLNFFSIKASFKVNVSNIGEQAKSEGRRIGENVVKTKELDIVC